MAKKIYLSLIAIAIAILNLFDTKILFCKDLIDLFSNPIYSEIGLYNAINFDPDNDTLYLPKLEGKDFFSAIEDLSICRIPEVRKFLYIYLTKGREYTIKAIYRSYFYLPLIKERMKNYPHFPEDIALLPLLESAFNPYATSKSNAVGIWQIIPSTAKTLGLEINDFVDERRNIIKSTDAALRHLDHLYRLFNSWELALLAYNGGCGYISRTMKQNGNTNFNDLIQSGMLRQETAEYLYRYAALVLIYKYPELFSIENDLIKPETDYDLELIEIKYPINVNALIQQCNIPKDIITTFNPQLKRSITPPKERNYILVLPKGSKEKIESLNNSLYVVTYTTLYTHKVKKGETLSLIAKQYRTQLRSITFINNLHNPHCIRPGEILFIPIH